MTKRETGGSRLVTAVFAGHENFSAIASASDAEDLQSWLDDLCDGVLAICGLSRAENLSVDRPVDAALRAVQTTGLSHQYRATVRPRARVATGKVVLRPGVHPHAIIPAQDAHANRLCGRIADAANASVDGVEIRRVAPAARNGAICGQTKIPVIRPHAHLDQSAGDHTALGLAGALAMFPPDAALPEPRLARSTLVRS